MDGTLNSVSYDSDSGYCVADIDGVTYKLKDDIYNVPNNLEASLVISEYIGSDFPYSCSYDIDEHWYVSNLQIKPEHPTELKNPLQSKRFKELLDNAYKIYLNKNIDYSPASVLYGGEIGVLIRVWDKFCRLMNLNGLEFPAIKPQLLKLVEDIDNNVFEDIEGFISTDGIKKRLNDIIAQSEFNWKEIKSKKPVNEPVSDAWNDLAIYSFIGLLVHEQVWGR